MWLVEAHRRAYRSAREARRLAEELQKAEARYRAILSEQTDLFARFREDGALTFANDAFLSFFGLSGEQALGQSIFDVLPPSERDPARQAVADLARDGAETAFEHHFQRAGGGPEEWLEWRLRRVTRTPVEVQAIGRLLTERHQRELQVARLAAAIEQAAETVVVTDLDGTIQYVNPAFEQMSGYSPAEVLGKKTSVVRSGKHADDFYRQLWDTISRGEVWRGHFVNRRKDGALYEEDATITPVRGPDGRLASYVAVKRDVTAAMALQQRLSASQRLESVGQLAGGIAQEFNNLLMTLLTTAELVAPEVTSRTAAEDLEVMRQTAKRGVGFVRSLLAFASRQHLDPVDLPLDAVVRDLLPMLERGLPRHLKLEEVSLAGGHVHADRFQLEQVLLDLCLHCAGSMPEHGTLTLSTSVETLDAAFCQAHPWARPGQWELVTIADTGKGMSPEVLARLFDPFSTGLLPGLRSLGLASAYGIVRQHGGMIEVECPDPRGTVFRVYLPHVDRPAPRAAPSPPALAPAGGGRILVVDDSDGLRHVVGRTLVDCGYSVAEARSADEALRVLSERPIDLVISDVVMSGMSGVQLLERVRERSPAMPFLLCSGFDDELYSRGTLPAENVSFLAKPFDLGRLLAMVRELLEMRSRRPV
ncbi:MAG: PAS domain S-box protein [Myxococcales bacterium]